MIGSDLTIMFAFVAGVVSFLSPCVLPLVPAYLSYLGGRMVATGANGEAIVQENRLTTFLHGLMFVLGFSTIFVALGAASTAIGGVVGGARFSIVELFGRTFTVNWFTLIGGIMVIIFGLHTLGVINIPFLNMDTRKQFNPVSRGIGYGQSYLMGVFFSAGWSACVGPVLGAILTVAANSGGQGVPLLIAYALGLGIPFLLAAAMVGQATSAIRKMGPWMNWIKIFTGVLLVLIGILLVTNRLTVIAPESEAIFNIQLALDGWVQRLFGMEN